MGCKAMTVGLPPHLCPLTLQFMFGPIPSPIAHAMAGLVICLLITPVCCADNPDLSAAGSSTAQLQSDLSYLASDDLRGRSVTDDTIHQAADFIVRRMTEIGLKMDSVDGKPLQPVEVPVGSQIGDSESNFATFQIPTEASSDSLTPETQLTLGNGFAPLAVGAENANVSGRLVFAGYGITAPKIGYDDYAEIDAQGAVVMILRKEPQLADPDSPFNGTQNSRHAYFQTKITNAVKHGAVAVLIVNDPKSIESAILEERERIRQERERQIAIKEQLKNLPEQAVKNREALRKKIARISDMLSEMQLDVAQARRGVMGLSEAGPRNKTSGKIPVASIARDTASEILQQVAGAVLTDIEQKIDRDLSPQSLQLDPTNVKLAVEIKPAIAQTNNVVGVLPGKGPLKEQTLVVGAHYDHVGMGGFGSLAPGTIAIHNGADDNASGTTALIGVARSIVQRLRDLASHRTVVFIAFTGEERGLVGSQHYVDHPLRPLDSTVTMINMDMVGRLRDNELTVYGTGTADKLNSIVDSANRKYKFDLYKVASGWGPSDHQSFYRAGVPVLFFFTGLHNDYHRPTDDSDKIDFGNLSRITDIVSDVTFQLAVRPDRPQYSETDRTVQIRRQVTAYLGLTLADFRGQVLVSGVSEGGPAESGGMKTGDKVSRLGKKSIRTSADVLDWLRERSPGDQVVVRVDRSGRMVDLNVKLGKRPE